MSADDEDFVFYGTPIEREEDITTRKKKAIAEASGQLRTALPPWKQEVRDEEGRRRFHGAFTGGFSAGFYNTVGSKEGWMPQTFTSSRKNRAEVKQQSIYNFLDEDEKAELEGHSLGTSVQFDTFGFTAADLARKQAEKEQQERPSAVPGPVPDELIVPVVESIGVKLLSKMGWRQGRSIKEANRNSLYDARREARKAFLALSDNACSQLADSKLDEEDVGNLPTENDDQFSKSTPAYVINPKQDLYGLGYDPFKQAPEFREKKRQRMSKNREMEHYRSLSIKGKVGPGFGIGALEELDAEDEDVYASGYEFQDTFVQEIEEPSKVNVDTLRILDKRRPDVLPGFKAASNPDHLLERFDPPVIPKDFVPHHKFNAPLQVAAHGADIPPHPVPPPEDNNLKVLIEGVAALVARCGKLFEDLSREKNQSNPLFSFLNGGNGSDFYAWKLCEEFKKRGEQPKQGDVKMPQNSEQLTAERRGIILGEKALERSSRDSEFASTGPVNIQLKLSDTFTKPAIVQDEHPHPSKPFHHDPEKQKRFEQFLKEKYEGGLRTKDSGGASNMSESARARERLEFEAAAEAIQQGTSGKEGRSSSHQLADLSVATGLQFTTGASGSEKDKVLQDEELIIKGMYPKREEFQWRPAPILCKRFDLLDPYMGKPPPVPRAKSKMDSLIFMPGFITTANIDKDAAEGQTSSSIPQSHNGKQGKETDAKDIESDVEVENVERPVDLYKAIFSDDSEDESESGNNNTSNHVEDTQKKIEAANTTLNRLMAGDFLESLGKELGLAVPPELALPGNKGTQKGTANVDSGKEFSLPDTNVRTIENILDIQQNTKEGRSTIGPADGGLVRDDHKKNIHMDKNLNTRISHKKHQSSSSSSEDERSKKHSRGRHRSNISNSDSDSSDNSDDYRDRHRSRSGRKRKEKSRDRSHSKHHRSKKARNDDSPKRARRSSERDHRDRRRKKYEK